MKESLLLEWDYEKNGDVDPASVKDHSNKKFFWICPKGHLSYLMPVTKRSIGHGCPVCSNHKIIKGINDFETTNPELMQEWFWEENNKEGVDPSTFSSGSSRLAWWKCKKCGNTWRTSVSNRTRIHSGCPYCANLKVKKGFNDLATLRPDLAKEWYQEKNGDLTPDEVVEGYANSMIAAEKYIRETLINTHPYRVALKYANDIEIDNNDELLAKWVYSTGVKEFVWKSGGHCLEILATEWYDEYRIVASDQEALAYVNEMKAAGKQAYHISTILLCPLRLHIETGPFCFFRSPTLLRVQDTEIRSH